MAMAITMLSACLETVLSVSTISNSLQSLPERMFCLLLRDLGFRKIWETLGKLPKDKETDHTDSTHTDEPMYNAPYELLSWVLTTDSWIRGDSCKGDRKVKIRDWTRLIYEASANVHTLIDSGYLKSIDDCILCSKNFLSMHL